MNTNARRRREDNLVEIRKIKRENNLQKKRREGLSQSQQVFPSAAAAIQLDVGKKNYSWKAFL
ncbi:unnamed protein product [Rhodiola kirilowii]